MSSDPDLPPSASGSPDVSAEWRELQQRARAAASGDQQPGKQSLCSSCWTELPDGALDCPNCGLSVAEMERERQARTTADSNWNPPVRVSYEMPQEELQPAASAAAPSESAAAEAPAWTPPRLREEDERALAAAAAGETMPAMEPEPPPAAAGVGAAQSRPPRTRPSTLARRSSGGLADLPDSARSLLLLGGAAGLMLTAVLVGAFIARLTFPG